MKLTKDELVQIVSAQRALDTAGRELKELQGALDEQIPLEILATLSHSLADIRVALTTIKGIEANYATRTGWR